MDGDEGVGEWLSRRAAAAGTDPDLDLVAAAAMANSREEAGVDRRCKPPFGCRRTDGAFFVVMGECNGESDKSIFGLERWWIGC